jgi:hypothetical protein
MLGDQEVDEVILLEHVALESEGAVVEAPPHLALLLRLEAALLPADLVIVDQVLAGEDLLRVDRIHYLLVLEEAADHLELHLLNIL